jgi:hypothetical protein
MATGGFTKRLLELLRGDQGGVSSSSGQSTKAASLKLKAIGAGASYARTPEPKTKGKNAKLPTANAGPAKGVEAGAKCFNWFLPEQKSAPKVIDNSATRSTSSKASKAQLQDTHSHLAKVIDFGPGSEKADTLFIQQWGCDPGLSLTGGRLEELEGLPTKESASIELSEETPSIAHSENFEEDKDSLANLSEAALNVIAGNPRTAPSKLCRLAFNFNAEIRATVARNSNALPETVWLLAKDHDEAVRLAVAEHLESHKSVLKGLCNDPSPLVAWRARNTLSLLTSGTGTRTVKEAALPADEPTGHDPLSESAQANPELPVSKLTQEEVEFLQLIAQKPSTPGRRLSQLAKHANARIRAAVAENANTPVEALWLLLKDAAAEVKVKLADNYNCPLEILEHLQQDKDQYVAWRARSILAKAKGESYPDISLPEEPSRMSPRLVHSH